MNKKNFASDNFSGVHPNILQAIINANVGDSRAYGEDRWTREATDLSKQYFGKNTEIFFVTNGTAANVLGLHAVLKPYQAVICANTAHINTNECGATENYIGSKLLTIATGNGKIAVNQIASFLFTTGNEHHVQPRVISLSQATELGIVYTLKELKEITDFAHSHDMLVHMDGARLANAVAYLGCSLEEATTGCGIDILSFGGTKSGMMFGDAVVFLNASLARDFKYIRKQGMQLLSKMRYVSAQFIALLTNDLWLENARHANVMAQLLVSELQSIEEIDLAYPVQTNAVFARLNRQCIQALQKEYYFHVWNDAIDEVRWMTSFDTQASDVKRFAARIRMLVKEG